MSPSISACSATVTMTNWLNRQPIWFPIPINVPFSLTIIFISLAIFSVLRAALRYAEQACNHFIAFKLLALIRDKVFQALRKLCPAKLESKDKGDLISVITSDIELLEVFYAHTISPVLILEIIKGMITPIVR